LHVNGLVRQLIDLQPPQGIFDETVVANLRPALSAGARHALVHRAVAAGDVLRLRRGLYCLAPPFLRATPHPFVVAAALHGPSHISLETALRFHGLIPEAVPEVASVTLSRARTFTTPLGTFSFHTVPAAEPRAGVTALEVEPRAWAFVADPIRAIADVLYLRPEVSWARDGLAFLTESLRIERDALDKISWKRMAEVRRSIRNRRVVQYLDGMKQGLGT
jgi:hypothetical protein